MSTIRKMIRLANLSKEDKLLQKHGITDEKNILTDLGRRTLNDFVFEDYKDKVVAAVQKVEDQNAKEAKKKA